MRNRLHALTNIDRQRIVAVATVLALSLGLAGCFSSLKVLRQADPNPYVKHEPVPTFAVEPMTFKKLKVDGAPESEYVAGLEADKRALWSGDKTFMEERFLQTLYRDRQVDMQPKTSGVKSDYVIRVNVFWIGRGYNHYVDAQNAQVRMRVQIRTRGGKVIDELEIEAEEVASYRFPTVRSRLERCGLRAAEELIRYVEGRQAG